MELPWQITLLKRWVTGERAKMEEEDTGIKREMYELARQWMAKSKLLKHPGHNICRHISTATDSALWK
jgi:hypothetical protein